MFAYGTKVTSLRDLRITGEVVGYGTLRWPQDPNINGDEEPVVVYLVKIAPASSSLGPAVVALRADMTELAE